MKGDKTDRKGIPLEKFAGDMLANKRVKASFEEYSMAMEAARFIKAMRTHAHLTQTALAKRMNVSQTVIGRLEQGKGKRGPTVEMLAHIARACNYNFVLSATPRDDEDELLEISVEG